jgi:hypothetical protein
VNGEERHLCNPRRGFPGGYGEPGPEEPPLRASGGRPASVFLRPWTTPPAGPGRAAPRPGASAPAAPSIRSALWASATFSIEPPRRTDPRPAGRGRRPKQRPACAALQCQRDVREPTAPHRGTPGLADTPRHAPQHFFSFFPLPHEHRELRSRPRIVGFWTTGLFVNITFACFMKSRGVRSGNHLLNRKVSAAESRVPETGSSAPTAAVTANRSTFTGNESTQLGVPSEYRFSKPFWSRVGTRGCGCGATSARSLARFFRRTRMPARAASRWTR